jgi:hypothetical protein
MTRESETLAEVVSGPEDVNRFQVVQWCDSSLYLQAKSGKEGDLPLLIKIPANCPVVITKNFDGQHFIVICLGDTSLNGHNYAKCNKRDVKSCPHDEIWSELRPECCYTRVTIDPYVT